MKKIIAGILNIVSTILTGIAFGLGSLTSLYQFKKVTGNSIGNYYTVTWDQEVSHLGMIILFFVLCAAALVVTVSMFMNKKKGMIVSVLSALLLLASGVGMFFLNKLYVMGTSIKVSYTNGEGAISMGVLLVIAGAFQVLKTLLIAKAED